MKTKLFSPVIALGILACFFMPAQAKAQTPYQVFNHTPCVMTISYTFYAWNGSSCATVCSTGTVNVFPSPPATIIPRPAGCNCGAQIDITHVNGLPITTISGSAGVPPFTPHGSGSSNCVPVINLNVNQSTADIHP